MLRPTSSAVLRLGGASRNAALVASSIIALVGLLAGAVRVLPWLLSPAVPWRVAEPFARGLAAVSLEAALLVGWPIGWALACFRFVEGGEARVLQSLGQPPHETVARLMPRGAPLALALAAVALVYGGDASAPGRVATDLVARARVACEAARGPATYSIPFTDMTWLCAPDREPRLVGSAPGAMASVMLTAKSARIAGDFRALDLDDARALVGGSATGSAPSLSAAPLVALHVPALSIHGMAPWARASTLSAPLRALVLGLTAWLCASVAAYVTLRRAGTARGHVLVLGAAGPVTSLGVLRLLETADARPVLFVLVPLAGGAAALLAAALLSRLRGQGRAASNLLG